MKRSEMVQIIADYIYDEMEDVHWMSENINKVAGRVVRKVEKAGMIPPTVELSAGGEFMSTRELLDYSEIDYEICWEPEKDVD